MSGTRARNTATSRELSRILTAHVSVTSLQEWLDKPSFDPPSVAALFRDGIVEVMYFTDRLVKTSLAPALAETFSLSAADSTALSQAMISTVTHCRQAGKSVTSGSKTSPPILAIMDALRRKDPRLRVPSYRPQSEVAALGRSPRPRSPQRLCKFLVMRSAAAALPACRCKGSAQKRRRAWHSLRSPL